MKMLAKNPEERYAQMADFQAALKTSGSHQIVSSPDLVRTHAKAHAVQASPMRDTTFSTGVGERVETEIVARRGKLVIGAVAAAVVIGGGLAYWQLGGGESASKPPTQVATNTPPKPVTPTTPAKPVAPVPPTKPVAATPKNVELRLASLPPGAQVVDDAGGEMLGVTPLVLRRPRGGAVTLRFEKDGYTASTRTMPLDADRAFELTLEQKPKKREHKPRESSSEPAKL
jgi:hypothetical protein